MIKFLHYLQLDKLSFWVGFLTASLFWWLWGILRPYTRRLRERFILSIQSARQGLQTGAEQRQRADTLKYAQGLHLAAPLFSLDEILIPPRLMAPPPLVDPDELPPPEDIISMSIPYAPDWPELAAVYGAHILTIFEALQGGANIAIIGHPGSGKTTTLAYLASQIARQDPAAGDLQDHIPVLVHVADLALPPKNPAAPLETLIDAVAERASTLSLPRLPELLRTSFELGNVVLLFDGLDELAPQPLQEAVLFLKTLYKEFANIRIVVAAPTHNFGGLPSLGLVPIPMAIWGKKEQAQFIQQWGKLWDQFVVNDLDKDNYIDPILLNGWLLNLKPAATPLEFTLKVWSAYAGDVRGPKGTDAIEAYILRMSVGVPKARATLKLLASQSLLTLQTTLTEKDARLWISGTYPEADETDSDLFVAATTEGEASPKDITIPRVLPNLTQSGLLITRNHSKLGFCHPVIAGYLAGQVFAESGGDRIFSQPSWLLKDSASYYYMESKANIGYHIHQMLNTSEPPLHQNTLTAGRWLRTISQTNQYRKAILQQLSGFLQDDNLPMGLRIRVLSALATSGDPGVITLFRQLLKSEHSNTRQLAAIGCGFSRDIQSVGEMVELLGDVPEVGRAICLALVNIGTRPALEAVASALLQGEEYLRRAAAEAFVNHPEEGHPTLKEGAGIDDLLVRRAVIYGLQRIRQSWAIQILEEMRIEDAQWVVKDAAAHAVIELNSLDPRIPRQLLPLEDTPWLIAFAGELGLGISAGESAREMLLRALRDGSEGEQLAAIGQIQQRNETGIFPAIYHLLYGSNPELSEAAFNVIWHIAATGAEFPPPIQFGLE